MAAGIGAGTGAAAGMGAATAGAGEAGGIAAAMAAATGAGKVMVHSCAHRAHRSRLWPLASRWSGTSYPAMQLGHEISMIRA
jgi:hypothetical protein